MAAVSDVANRVPPADYGHPSRRVDYFAQINETEAGAVNERRR